jgi:hypothetical protein
MIAKQVIAALLTILPAGLARADVSTLNEISPAPASFALGVDQEPFGEFAGFQTPVTGSVTSFVELIPDFGCSASDFAGFTPGDIALIERNSCSFSLKGANAQAAAATGFFVFDSTAEPLQRVVLVASPTVTIPALFLTQAVGQTFETELSTGPVKVSFTVSSVPEPSYAGAIAVLLALSALLLRRPAARGQHHRFEVGCHR